jgi:hypothetical protein
MSPTAAPSVPSNEHHEDVEKPLPMPGGEEPTNAGKEESSAKPAAAMATAGEVFSFMPDFKTKVYFGAGIFCASVSGCIFPAMAFLFSNSFADLSGSTSK